MLEAKKPWRLRSDAAAMDGAGDSIDQEIYRMDNLVAGAVSGGADAWMGDGASACVQAFQKQVAAFRRSTYALRYEAEADAKAEIGDMEGALKFGRIELEEWAPKALAELDQIRRYVVSGFSNLVSHPRATINATLEAIGGGFEAAAGVGASSTINPKEYEKNKTQEHEF